MTVYVLTFTWEAGPESDSRGGGLNAVEVFASRDDAVKTREQWFNEQYEQDSDPEICDEPPPTVKADHVWIIEDPATTYTYEISERTIK